MVGNYETLRFCYYIHIHTYMYIKNHVSFVYSTNIVLNNFYEHCQPNDYYLIIGIVINRSS